MGSKEERSMLHELQSRGQRLWVLFYLRSRYSGGSSICRDSYMPTLLPRPVRAPGLYLSSLEVKYS